jgi:AsmA protein
LRLSIRRLIVRNTSFEAVAAGLILADARLDLTLSQGLPRQSGGKLRLVATPDDEGLSVKTQVSGENVDIGAIMSALSPRPALSGTGAFTLNLEGRGAEVATLLRSLSGKASLLMKAGLLSLDSEGTPVASVAASEASAPVAARRFSEASFAGIAERGVLTLTEGRIGTGASQVLIDGRIDVGDRGLDLSLSGVDGAKPDSAWHLRAVGPWGAPALWREPTAQ